MFGKIITAANESEADVENALAKGTAAVAVVESALTDPTNFAGDVTAATAAVADLKAAMASFEAVLTSLKSI